MFSTQFFKSAPASTQQNQNPNCAIEKPRTFTLDELYEYRHESKRCLVGLFGHVYDIRKFLPYHPGLEKPIRNLQGQDISDIFTEDPNHVRLSEEKVLKLLNDSGCEEIGTLCYTR